MKRLPFLLFVVALVPVPSCSKDAETTSLCDEDDQECIAKFLCGNGKLDAGEGCDGTGEYCAEDCSESLGSCGDGIVQEDFGEQCDPGKEGRDQGGMGGAAMGGASMGGASMGGASSVPSLEGCSSKCRAKNGYVCDPEENTCGQTGVDDEAIAADHLQEVCTWIVGLMGGQYTGTHCVEGGTIYDFVAPDVATCVDKVQLDDECTIGTYEAWALQKNRCEIFLEKAPCAE